MHVLGNMPIQQNYPQRILQIKIRTQTGKSIKDSAEEETTRYYRLLVINSRRDMSSKHRLLGERTTHSGRNLTPQGTKSHNRKRKERTPGIPVTGHIIGDQPSVNWELIQDTHHPKGELKKQTQFTGWTFHSIRKYESYSTEEEKDFN